MESFIDLGLIRGIITAVLFFAFCGVVVWAWSGRRHETFEAASRMPLNDDDTVHKGDPS